MLATLKQCATHLCQHQKRNRHQHEHPCPSLDTRDARLGEAEQSLSVTEAFFTGEAARIFLAHPQSRQVPIREQVPHLPMPLLVTSARLHEEAAARISFRVPDSPPRTPSMIPTPAQRVESTPTSFDQHLVVGLGANDVGNAHFIQQIEQVYVGKPAVCCQHQAAAHDTSQHFVKQEADELSLVQTHPLCQLRVRISTPKERDGAATDPNRSYQQVLGALSRPVQTEAHGPGNGQLRNERTGMCESQLLGRKSRVVQQTRETLRGSFKVVKETGQSSLTATLHGNKCEHEVGDSFLLMPVCVGQNKTDILAEASGNRVSSHRKPMLSRVADS